MRSKESAALQKAIQALRAIGQSPRGVSIAQLSKETGITRQGLGRLLATLTAEQFVIRNDDKTFRLDLHLFDWTRSVAEAAAPLRLIRREIVRLVQETRTGASYSVLEGSNVIAVERIIWVDEAAIAQNRSSLWTWEQVPSGRAILAFSSPRLQQQLLAQSSDNLALLKQLDAIRERGFEENATESSPGRVPFAVPVLDADGFAAGAVAASHASVGDDALDWLTPFVLTAERISRLLGYSGHWPGVYTFEFE